MPCPLPLSSAARAGAVSAAEPPKAVTAPASAAPANPRAAAPRAPTVAVVMVNFFRFEMLASVPPEILRTRRCTAYSNERADGDHLIRRSRVFTYGCDKRLFGPAGHKTVRTNSNEWQSTGQRPDPNEHLDPASLVRWRDDGR